jgi:outer membrane protein
MKKWLFSALFIFAAISVHAQRYAYVDTDYILSHIPAYKAAQEKLNELSVEWQKQVEQLYEEAGQMRRKFQNEQVLLTPEMQEQRKEQIADKEKMAQQLQKQYFGPQGAIFQRREELIKPIQSEVFTAINEIAEDDNYALVFDIAAGPIVIYTDPKYDISDEVLQLLGYKGNN